MDGHVEHGWVYWLPSLQPSTCLGMGQGIGEMSVDIVCCHCNVAAKDGVVVVRNYVADDVQPMTHYVHKTCDHLGHASTDFLTKLP